MYKVTILALALLLIFIAPVFTIMALNTLFDFGIELTLTTWLATLWLMLCFGAARYSTEK